ncbi:predicted protein [Enterococcus faecium 1,141,733]|nr:predicted protein [Enterococcus faecium 1,141,733]
MLFLSPFILLFLLVFQIGSMNFFHHSLDISQSLLSAMFIISSKQERTKGGILFLPPYLERT